MFCTSMFSAVFIGFSTLCYANPPCQERTIYTDGSLITAEYDWGALSSITSVDGTNYNLERPYMGDGSQIGSGDHKNIDYHCAQGSYFIHAAPTSSPGTDGKIYEYCSYSLVSVECHD
jgi:hypothetical protein